MAFDPRRPDHLPHRREGGLPAPPEGLPRQRRGVTPQMRGRYPDYDVLEAAGHWDERTRAVLFDRVEHPPPIRFFSAAEAETLTAFCDTAMAQEREPRIPVLRYVDEKLRRGRLDGYQYADMPDDRETWRLVARGLDQAARERGEASFAAAPADVRVAVVADFAHACLRGGAWEQLNVARAWTVVMRDVLAAFYAHPWAWSEIGFGGPAYPRGYARLGVGQRDAWEGREAFAVDPVQDVRARGVDR
jgi:Gluconate 2-dehydrogenase subunit 3